MENKKPKTHAASAGTVSSDSSLVAYYKSTVNQKTYLYLSIIGGVLCLHRFWVDSYYDATIRLVLFVLSVLVSDFVLVPVVIFEILSLIEGFGSMLFHSDENHRILSPPPYFWQVIQMTVRISQQRW